MRASLGHPLFSIFSLDFSFCFRLIFFNRPISLIKMCLNPRVSGANSKQFAKKSQRKKTTVYGGRKHFIHPIFKRNVNWENIHPVEKFDLAHHRRTRHILYQQIEKFLEA